MELSALRIAAKKILEYFIPHAIKQKFLQEYYFHIVKNFRQEKEKDLFLCGRLIKKGDIVVDIGANIGIYTKLFSEYVGPKGLVHSFEPIHDTFLTLNHVAKRLGLVNVQRYQMAISNESGRKKMYFPLDYAGLPSVYEPTLIEPSGRAKKTEVVAAQTLDNALNNCADRISFIKCDVEGHEKSVIEGARRTISKSQPALLIEVRCQPESLIEIMKPIKYTAFWFAGKSIWEITKARPSKYENIFYFTQKHVHELSRQGLEINLA